MKILGISHKDSGCAYHRVVLPMGYLAYKEGFEGFAIDNPNAETIEQGWDLVLFNRFSPFDSKYDVLRQKLNCKIVMDIDDDWELPYSHINYDHYIAHKNRLEDNIRNADYITVTNERIANKVKKLRNDVEILPNALPFGREQFTEEREPFDKVRIFWCGSATHQKDLELLRNPIKRLSEFKDKIQMVIGGYSDSNEPSRLVWDRMLRNFTSNLSLPFQILRSMRPVDYMALYEHADIMLIPLENSPWHACKSNLKILEAAAKKIPVIVSAVEPYTNDLDAPVFWVHKQTDWYKHLKTLINDEQKRKEAGEALYNWAVRNYNLDHVNDRRADLFTGLRKA